MQKFNNVSVIFVLNLNSILQISTLPMRMWPRRGWFPSEIR